MTQTKHTPAPWHYVHNKKLGMFQVCDTVYHNKGETSLLCSVNYDLVQSFPETQEANARLIAAAPELLEALENVIDVSSPVDANQQGFFESGIIISYGALLKIRAAIAKAKGE